MLCFSRFSGTVWERIHSRETLIPVRRRKRLLGMWTHTHSHFNLIEKINEQSWNSRTSLTNVMFLLFTINISDNETTKYCLAPVQDKIGFSEYNMCLWCFLSFSFLLRSFSQLRLFDLLVMPIFLQIKHEAVLIISNSKLVTNELLCVETWICRSL